MADFMKKDCMVLIFTHLNGRNFFNFDFYKKTVQTFFVEYQKTNIFCRKLFFVSLLLFKL